MSDVGTRDSLDHHGPRLATMPRQAARVLRPRVLPLATSLYAATARRTSSMGRLTVVGSSTT